MTLRPATDSDARDMASILVEAFADKFQIIFGSHLEEGRKAVAAEIRLRAREGYLEGTFVAQEEEQMVGIVACRTADTSHAPLLPLLRAFWREIGPWGMVRALVGLALLSGKPASDECYIDYLAVRSEWRRRGIGTALLRQAQEYARSQGKRRLTLEVSLRNEDAPRLYQRLGFSPMRQERSCITGRFFDIPLWLRMEKHLS